MPPTDPPDNRPRTARDLFRKDPAPRPTVTPALPADDGTGNRYARRALNNELATLAATPDGQRNAQLNVSAYNLAQLVAAGHLDATEVTNALRTTALGIGLTLTETHKTIASAFDAGSAHPRQIPDNNNDDRPPAVTVLHFPEVADDQAADAVDKLFPVIDWHALWLDQTVDEWILYPLVPARRLVALFSPPKVGKSLLMLELAAAISRGADVLGEHVTPRTVLYVDFENDPRGDVRTRLQAMGLTPDDLGNLKMVSFPRLAFLDTPTGGLQLLGLAQHHGAEVVIIDTISRAVGGEENANDTWLGFYKHCGLLLKAADIACIRLDHTGKDESKGMRGGSAKYGDVDAVWAMKRIDDVTYQLECTANRLPIGEKLLVLRRESNPLRHVVDGKGLGAVLDTETRNRIRLLDEVHGSAPVSIVAANRTWKAAGLKTMRRGAGDPVHRLLADRERAHGRAGIVPEEDDPFGTV